MGITMGMLKIAQALEPGRAAALELALAVQRDQVLAVWRKNMWVPSPFALKLHFDFRLRAVSPAAQSWRWCQSRGGPPTPGSATTSPVRHAAGRAGRRRRSGATRLRRACGGCRRRTCSRTAACRRRAPPRYGLGSTFRGRGGNSVSWVASRGPSCCILAMYALYNHDAVCIYAAYITGMRVFWTD